ncbi:MAG: pyridoxal phosphate-dependent aminotransferase [Planctomycetes bacterium]|nr:pyridoxal phosphate-dependent aminotransferase [Planctomycetota bacterium]
MIRQVSDGAPPDAIPFGLGEPTWDLPQAAREALARTPALCSYGPQVGRIELRRAIAARYHARPEDVVVTNGTQEALYVVCQAYLDPGDEVLVPDPGFVGYRGVARLAGAQAVSYGLSQDGRFRLCAETLTAALDAHPRAKLCLIGHPANPTGGGADLETLKRVAAACRERGVLLVSDEVYRELWFDRKQPSLRDADEDGLVLDSVSKSFGAPGLRVGWVIGADALLAPIRVIHGYAVTCASTPAQWAATAMLEAAEPLLAQTRSEIAMRFEIFQSAMREYLGHEVTPPDGSFYHFLKLPERAHEDPLAFCLRLRDEAKVVLVPGLAFGENGRGYARLSFAARPEQIREGVRRLAAWWEPA